jgi:hypothetical protein
MLTEASLCSSWVVSAHLNRRKLRYAYSAYYRITPSTFAHQVSSTCTCPSSGEAGHLNVFDWRVPGDVEFANAIGIQSLGSPKLILAPKRPREELTMALQ